MLLEGVNIIQHLSVSTGSRKPTFNLKIHFFLPSLKSKTQEILLYTKTRPPPNSQFVNYEVGPP
jgi:hypothetical protein